MEPVLISAGKPQAPASSLLKTAGPSGHARLSEISRGGRADWKTDDDCGRSCGSYERKETQEKRISL